MTPSASVALRMLDALGVTSVEQAREVLVLWCRPAPRLSVLDVRQILAAIERDAPAGRSAPDGPDGPPDIVVYDTPHGPVGYALSGSAPDTTEPAEAEPDTQP